ncbi:hypothetical protein J6590_013532, partial [Homalodisca vitripennis]
MIAENVCQRVSNFCNRCHRRNKVRQTKQTAASRLWHVDFLIRYHTDGLVGNLAVRQHVFLLSCCPPVH